MKIAPKAAESFLVNPGGQCRAVLVYGPDSGLIRERVLRIKTNILAGNDDPFAFVELEESTVSGDPARLADELSAMSLMGGKRLIYIRDGGDKLTKIIEGVTSLFHDSVFLMVAGDDLPSRSSLRAFFDKDSSCASLACYKDDARDVQSVIRKKLSEAGIACDQDTMEYLAGQLGNDRYVTYQELEKIILFAGDSKRINLEETQALVDYNRDSDLDDVVVAVADKNLAELDAMLTVHRREGSQPVAYLRTLMRYFNRLYYIRAKMATGENLEEIIRSLRPPVFFKQAPALTRHARHWETHQIVKALRLLLEAELACKTSDLPVLPASHRKLMQVTQLR